MKTEDSFEKLAISVVRNPFGFSFIKVILALLLAGWLSTSTARAQSAPVTIAVTATNFTGYAIPIDFSGLSFGTETAASWFQANDVQLINLFQQINIRNLRMMGDVIINNISNQFAFAQSEGNLQIIYGVPLATGGTATNAAAAAFIWNNDSSLLDCFEIGNEPDWSTANKGPIITNFTSFLTVWRENATAMSNAAPGASFEGIDTGGNFDNGAPDGSNGAWAHNGTEWTTDFASDEKGSSIVALITQHHYLGDVLPGNQAITNAAAMINAMMSPGWDTVTNQILYNVMAAPVLADGFPYRFTETDENSSGGIAGATDTFASALWTLDHMHWWAAHGAAGLNFHNQFPDYTDTITMTNGLYLVRPKAYGIKAFDLGGHGYVEPVQITNKNNLNLTAYANGDSKDLYVTIINKESASGSNANVTILPNGFASASVASMPLTAPSGLSSKTGVLLGGSYITNNARWLGTWTPLSPATNGQCTVTVGLASAAVVHIHAASSYEGPIQINNNGALEMLGTDTNGNTLHRWQFVADVPGSGPTNWASWTVLSGNVTNALGGAAVAKDLDGTLEAFISGSDGNVYHNYQLIPSGSWSGWYSIGGPNVTNLQVAINPDGSLNLFGIGSNGDVWNNSQLAPEIAGGTWTDLSGVKIQPGFVVGQNLDGRLEIFGVDANSNVWHNWETSSGGWTNWSGWNSLGGTVNPRLQVVRNLDGRLELFGVGASGALNYTWQMSPGGSWTNWNTTDLGTRIIEPGFVVGQNADGRFEILGVSNDGNVYHNWITITSGNWSGWNSLSGAGTDPQLVMSSTKDGRLQVFGIDTANNDVWSDWQTSPGGSWNGWTDFGGTGGVIFYPGQP